jgi:twitching motility protein PilT
MACCSVQLDAMTLADSLLSAIVRADGDALVMHVGERPYVVVGANTVNISTQGLNLDSMTQMLAQLLPADSQAQLEEFGAVEHRLPDIDNDRFNVVAARGGDDIWIEIRRRRSQTVEAVASPADGHMQPAAPVAVAVADGDGPVQVSAHTSAAVADAPAPPIAPVAVTDTFSERRIDGPAASIEPVELAEPVQPAAPVEPAAPVGPQAPAEPIHAAASAATEAQAPAEIYDSAPLAPAVAEEPVRTESEPESVIEWASAAESAPSQELPYSDYVPWSLPDEPAAHQEATAQADAAPEAVAEPLATPVVQPAEAEAPTLHAIEEPITAPAPEPVVEAAAHAEEIEHVAADVEAGATPPAVDTPEPFSEAEPVATVEPVVTVEPVAPMESVIAAEPVAPVAATDAGVPVEPAASVESFAASEATVPSEPVAASEPAAPAEPVTPAESMAPPRADQPIESAPVTRTVRIEVPPRMPVVTHSTDVERLVRLAASRGASSLLLQTDSRPYLRVEGDVRQLDGEPVLTRGAVELAIAEIAPGTAHDAVGKVEPGEWLKEYADLGRVRCSTFADHRGPGLMLRLESTRAATAEQLGLSSEVCSLATESEGLVIVAGPRASGKTTLLSALVDLVNRQRAEYVITLERQIQLVHENKAALISQREVRGSEGDALSAAHSALRERPDVLVIDDLISPHMVPVILTAASEGLLVFVSVAAPSTADAVQRFVELASPEMRPAVQNAMAESFRGAVAQTRLKKSGGGLVTAREVLLATAPVSRLVAEGQLAQLPHALDAGREYGMLTFEETLVEYVRTGLVDVREAFRKAPDRDRLLIGLRREGVDTRLVDRLV